MRILISVILFSTHFQSIKLPDWFAKAFNSQKLNERYTIINHIKPYFLEADFNGDKINDVAVQIINKASKKKGVLIINGGSGKHCIFGAGFKFDNEDFSDTNWLNGWHIYRKSIAYKTLINSDGDIIGGKKVKISHPAINIYATEDGEEYAGQLIYWNGLKYVSIHQGE